MKKKTLTIIVIAAALVIILSVAAIIYFSSRNKTDSIDVEAAYNNLLGDLYDVFFSPEGATVGFDGAYSIQKAAQALGDDALDKVEYSFSDINNDGTEELLIGCFEASDSSLANNELYAAYTHDGQDLVLLFEKQARNSFALTDTNTFYFYGSDGEKYHIIAEYEIAEDGKLVCKDFYFTYPKSESATGMAYYHNTSGEWDPEKSEELDITAEAFEEIRKELAAKTVQLTGEKFAALTNGENVE